MEGLLCAHIWCMRAPGEMQVCCGCELVRLCKTCGPEAWQEGHNRVCLGALDVPRATVKDIKFLPHLRIPHQRISRCLPQGKEDCTDLYRQGGVVQS